MTAVADDIAKGELAVHEIDDGQQRIARHVTGEAPDQREAPRVCETARDRKNEDYHAYYTSGRFGSRCGIHHLKTGPFEGVRTRLPREHVTASHHNPAPKVSVDGALGPWRLLSSS